MMPLTVYADILIITNLIVDYFLLAATARITGRKPPLWRHITAALAAAISTLIIFLPQQTEIAEFLYRLALSLIICLICFGFGSLRRWILTGAVFFAVTFCYAGAMMAIWYIFKPRGMAINNSVVYFDISPLFLITFSVLGFLIFSVSFTFLSRRNKTAKECFVTLVFCGENADFAGIIDSGNSLKDIFAQSPVVVADPDKVRRVFGDLSAERFPEKYRAVPCKTVLGTQLLDGFRCDSGTIITDKKTVKLTRPVMAISKTPLEDCEIIVNPIDCLI